MLKKNVNIFSKKIRSIEFYDSISVINFSENDLNKSKNLENNKKLRNFFDDYRYKKDNNIKKNINDKSFYDLVMQSISKRSYLFRIYENSLIRKYIQLLKK